MNKSKILAILLILLSVVISISLYSILPEPMASHWDAAGEVNGYMPKFWALALMPIIMSFILILFSIIPKIDPLRKNMEYSKKYLDRFMVAIQLFMFYIFVITLVSNLGTNINMTLAVIPAFAALFYFVGIMLENIKQNWFMGIRTPWTLSSKMVWIKTHKLGAKLFKLSAVISLIGLLFPRFAFFIMIGPVCISAISLVIYSYIEFKKER